MLNNKKEFKCEIGGKEYIFETGRLAKQADGAVLVTCGATQVLVTVCCANSVNDGQDFFPLLVDYKEKFYAAGKFLGGFKKREGRPSDAEILLMRLIDRPLRPLFPEGFMFETVITANVLSFDGHNDPEILAGLGASAALEVSNIPFNGPLGFVKIGKIDGKLVVNPGVHDWEKSDLELVVAASMDALLMVEGEANELSEEEMLAALEMAHNEIQKICAEIKNMGKSVGATKREFSASNPNKTTLEKVEAKFKDQALACLAHKDKLVRRDANAKLQEDIAALLTTDFAQYNLAEDTNFNNEARKLTDELLYKLMRSEIIYNTKRIDGRSLTQVRPIETEVSVLKAPHGSSLFTRGETQVMAAVTIGGKDGEQMNDKLSGISYDRFYLHYHFPPFSVGEAKGYRGLGRREIGHGNLAERAIKKLLPKYADFPYTVRINCEVLESNGSSSMGSVCSGSMALMDAGVPIKKPVAGIAMGLVMENGKYQVLTDILGDEDHLGDMDFKVAGTADGITAIQMDIKIAGITKEICSKALSQAKEGRIHILSEMAKTISLPKTEFKDGVPVIISTKIKEDKIGALIGPGGKNIKGIQEHYKVTIDVKEDGTTNILAPSKAIGEEVALLIDLQMNGPQLGADYVATVVTIKEYGAFVDIAQGVSGLVHVSEFSDERVKDVNEYLRVGDRVKVKVLDVDRFGKVKLSMKAIESIPLKYPSSTGA